MRILCILDKPALMKTIKNCCKENDFDIKTISPEDEFDTYFADYKPSVIILQSDYDDVSIKFLSKLLTQYDAFNKGIKLLIVEDVSQLESLSTFAKEYDMLLAEEETVGPALCTKIKAMDAEKIQEHTPKEQHLSRRKRLLYVSDNKFMHIIVKDACLDSGIEFIDAYDGEEALLRLKDSTPNLVLTDMDIPGLSGVDLCKAIKHSNAYSHIPVVIYSSYEKEEVLQSCNTAGADDYYEKIINPKDLVSRIERFF